MKSISWRSSIIQIFWNFMRSSRMTRGTTWWQSFARVENSLMRSSPRCVSLRRRLLRSFNKFFKQLHIAMSWVLCTEIWSPRTFWSIRSWTTPWKLSILEHPQCSTEEPRSRQRTEPLTISHLRCWPRNMMTGAMCGAWELFSTSCCQANLHLMETTMKKSLNR